MVVELSRSDRVSVPRAPYSAPARPSRRCLTSRAFFTCEPGSVSLLPPEDPGAVTCSGLGEHPRKAWPFFVPRIGTACIPAGAGCSGLRGVLAAGSHSRGAPAGGAGVLFLSSVDTEIKDPGALTPRQVTQAVGGGPRGQVRAEFWLEGRTGVKA